MTSEYPFNGNIVNAGPQRALFVQPTHSSVKSFWTEVANQAGLCNV